MILAVSLLSGVEVQREEELPPGGVQVDRERHSVGRGLFGAVHPGKEVSFIRMNMILTRSYRHLLCFHILFIFLFKHFLSLGKYTFKIHTCTTFKIVIVSKTNFPDKKIIFFLLILWLQLTEGPRKL